MTYIFDESQRQRDIELSAYLEVPIPALEKIEIGSPPTIKVFEDVDIDEEAYDYLYKKFDYLNFPGYLRTLSTFAITRRGKFISNACHVMGALKGKVALDYGCAVGTHGIQLAQLGMHVDFLDVDGPLLDYAKYRIKNRKITNFKILHPDSPIPENHYDIVVCMDVLEHIANPVPPFIAMMRSMKRGSILCLEVSQMVKPTSGHFSKCIDAWNKKGLPILKHNFKPLQTNIFVKR